MSTANKPIVESTEETDLDAFSATFFGQKSATKEPASSEEPEAEDDQEDSDAQEDTQDGEDDTPATDDDDESDEDEVEDKDEDLKPEPAPKKNRFQERIDELTAGKREAERKAADLEARLARLEQNTPKPEPIAIKTAVEDTGPSPDDKNEDGTDKYGLGEFDPLYIRDLTKHTFAVERAALVEQETRETEQKEMAIQQAAMQTEWNEKLGPAKERYPDFTEKGQQLVDTFSEIDAAYGEYLSATLMSMEYGPDVLYYLSNHPDEAKKIVNSGATKATIALGRLESKFAFAEEEKQKARPKISKAPVPPVHMNKGSAVSKPEVSDDTDDLDAFAAKFFAKKRGR